MPEPVATPPDHSVLLALGPSPVPTAPATSPEGEAEPQGLLSSIAVTTAASGLLLVGLIGFGIHPDPVFIRRIEPPPTRLLEDVALQPVPPAPVDSLPPPPLDPVPSVAVPAAASIDLPPLPATAEITAVAADVPVAFSIPVTGPVKIVKDPAHASGAVGGRPDATAPISVDAGEEHARFLLLPNLAYPPTALERRISGTVEIEFKTLPTGVLTEIRIRQSSGYADLDRAALQNMRRGRWTGEPGFFVKKYVFVLN